MRFHRRGFAVVSLRPFNGSLVRAMQPETSLSFWETTAGNSTSNAGRCLKKTTPTSSAKLITLIEPHCYFLYLDRGGSRETFSILVWANSESEQAAAIRVPSGASEVLGRKLESALREQRKRPQVFVAELSRVESKFRQRMI